MPHKKTFRERAKPWVNPGLIITIGGTLITIIAFLFNAIIENTEVQMENKQLQFQSVEQRVKTKDHVDSPYNPVNAYKQSVELTEQTAIVQGILEDSREKDSINKLKEVEKDKSRDARDSVNRLILEELKSLKKRDTTQ